MRPSQFNLANSPSNRGFTLVELLVVIGIIAILAGVALGPITNGIKKAQESGAMQTTRTLALAEFQYANDNNGSYPDSTGTSAVDVCKALMTGNYVSDPNLFYIAADKDTGAAKPTTVAAFSVNNCSFDFMERAELVSAQQPRIPSPWSGPLVARQRKSRQRPASM